MDQQMIAARPLDLVSCCPPPDWVVHEPYPTQAPEPGDAYVVNGICQLLNETQVNLGGGAPIWHYRTAQRVLTRAGAERAAHFKAEFEPTYQRLEVHFIHILRGEEQIDHARPDALQTFRRETNLERLILDGRLTTSLLIPDVRVDDIIEISVTLYGANPVLNGKYSAWVGFNDFNPWLENRHRLLRTPERPVAIKPFNDPPESEIMTTEGFEDLRWRVSNQKRREGEALTPPWQILVPALLFSEFAGWNEVARLFAPLYESPHLPDALTAEIERLMAEYTESDQRAAEWLRFVQNTLRYFALSLGEGGLTPRPIETIWSSRLGDCKDAARFYVAGARRMGLDACAAIVSTTHGALLNNLLPATNMFNHCIVRLRLNGKSYWLDPTMQAQSGSLDNIYQAHAGWALPLTEETEGLEKLAGDAPVHYLDLEEVITFGPKRTSPARLRRRAAYSSWAADTVRNRIANQGAGEYGKAILKEMQNLWPKLTEIEPVSIADDPVLNRCTLTSTYEIPACWTLATKGRRLEFKLVDRVIAPDLQKLKAAERHTDIYLGRPRKLTHTVRMEMPRKWSGQGWQNSERAPGVSYFNRVAFEERSIESAKALEIDAWSLPAARSGDYQQLVEKIHVNQLTIWSREWFGELFPPSAILLGLRKDELWMIWVVIVLIIMILGQASSFDR